MAISYNSGTNTITVTGYSETTPCTFEDIYQADVSNGWGKVSKQGDVQYLFSCKLQIGNGSTPTYFKDTNKQVTFVDGITSRNGYLIRVRQNAIMELGTLANEVTKATKDGCSFFNNETTELYNYIIQGEKDYPNVYIYSCSFSAAGVASDARAEIAGVKRIYNSFMGTGGYIRESHDIDVYNIMSINTNDALGYDLKGNFEKIMGVGVYRGTHLTNDMVVKDLTAIDNIYAVTVAAYYFSTQGYLIDCEFDNWNIQYMGTITGNIYRQYTFNPVITDVNGNPITNAHVVLKDKDGNVVIDDYTDSNGEILNGTEPHIVTYAHYDQAGGSTPYLHGPHTLIISKTGYHTYTSKITIDEKKRLVISLKNRREV